MTKLNCDLYVDDRIVDRLPLDPLTIIALMEIARKVARMVRLRVKPIESDRYYVDKD